MTDRAPSAHERRQHPRLPTNCAGRAWYGAQGAMWADCTLRDLSVGGARIEIPAAYELPRRLYFAHKNEPAIYLAVLKWQRGGAAGIAFQEGYPLDACTTAPLDRMAAEWRALYA
ncbi:PilZ domain-containing protein [Phenylobacterium sp. LjRoot219]|uniref:PilZ domain-containing protein n=1 Tax=Phenylobacterium sp. LjRoot219 TaxID=3342283 RepID=UPI003ED05FC6